jgi:hypothetical protein
MGGQLPHVLKAAQQAVTAAESHAHAVAREYGAAFTAAIERERMRMHQQLQGRPAVYPMGGVIIRDHDVAALRERLDAATVAVTKARENYRKVYGQHLTQPGGSS